MRVSRTIAGALALAATSAYAGQSGHAGQVTIYEGADFDGHSVIANADVSYVKRYGFGDSASSIVVNDGIWEACTDPWYRGRCVRLPPGNYRRIDVTLGQPVTSVRQLAASDRVVVQPAPTAVVVAPTTTARVATVTVPAPVVVNPTPVVVSPPAPVVAVPAQPVVVSPPVVAMSPMTGGRIELYEYPNFGGQEATVDLGQAKDLDWANFSNPNHRASSIRVDSGSWIVCTDIGFRGQCTVLDPGEYPQLTGALRGGVASAQQVWRPEYGALTIYSR
jgi:hypothetical protein